VIIISELPKAPAARLMKSVGASRISGEAVDMLTEAMEDYGTDVARKANAFAHHAGRKTIKASDVKLAMQ
jgi:histone H3/H4